MTITEWGRPELPPRPKSRGSLVAHFPAFLDRACIGVNPKGLLVARFTVPHEDKWRALLLDRAQGYEVFVEVFMQPEPTDDELAAKLGLDL
jgi:hypothetical protein